MAYIVVKRTKSVGLGILLTFFLGPIGLFYSSVIGGLIMTFGPIVALTIAIFLQDYLLSALIAGGLIIYIFLGWLVCIIWSIISVTNYNRGLIKDEFFSKTYSIKEPTYYLDPSFNYSTPARKNAFKELIFLVLIVLAVWVAYKNSEYFRIEAKPQKSNTSWTNQADVNLFLKPNIKAKVLGHIPPGSSFTSLDQTKYFINVDFIDSQGRRRKGYIQKSKLKQIIAD